MKKHLSTCGRDCLGGDACEITNLRIVEPHAERMHQLSQIAERVTRMSRIRILEALDILDGEIRNADALRSQIAALQAEVDQLRDAAARPIAPPRAARRCARCQGRGVYDDGQNGWFAAPNVTCEQCDGKGFIQ